MAWPGLAALALFPFFDSSSGLVKYPKTRPFFFFLLSSPSEKEEEEEKTTTTEQYRSPFFRLLLCARKIYDGQFRQSSVAADKKKRNKRSE
jgi:hypothetical protein